MKTHLFIWCLILFGGRAVFADCTTALGGIRFEAPLTDAGLYERVLALLDRPNEDPECTTEYCARVDASFAHIDWRELRIRAKRDATIRALRNQLDDARIRMSNTISRSSSDQTLSTLSQARSYWAAGDAEIERWIDEDAPFDITHLKTLHRIIVPTSPHAGRLREVGEETFAGPVMEKMYVPGSQVDRAMRDFFAWFSVNEARLHPLVLAGLTYQRLVSIHPFADGNGRFSRLVMDWVLQKHGYPPSSLGYGFIRNSLVAVFARLSDADNVYAGKAELAAMLGVNMSITILHDGMGPRSEP